MTTHERHSNVSANSATIGLLDPALVTVAAGQHGMFTTRQAHATGLDRRDLGHLVKTGALRHPGRGLYAVSAQVSADPEQWHLQLAFGARLLYDDVTFTGVTALLAHGITVWDGDLRRPQILRPVHRSSTLECFHMRPNRSGSSPQLSSHIGPTLGVADALVQFAIDQSIESAVVSMDDALHRTLVTTGDLEAALAAVMAWPGSHRARSAVALADGRRESAAESRCGVALSLGDVEVIPQVVIRDRRGRIIGRVDFLVAGTNVILEVDGKVKYASGDPEVLWLEKQREDALRAAGYVVVRIVWADFLRPGGVLAKVRRAKAA